VIGRRRLLLGTVAFIVTLFTFSFFSVGTPGSLSTSTGVLTFLSLQS
jgi:hypothetical protein